MYCIELFLHMSTLAGHISVLGGDIILILSQLISKAVGMMPWKLQQLHMQFPAFQEKLFNIMITQGCHEPISNLKPSMDSQDRLDAKSGVSNFPRSTLDLDRTSAVWLNFKNYSYFFLTLQMHWVNIDQFQIWNHLWIAKTV